MASSGGSGGGGGGSPCGACKFLRRKCAPDCIFAPYFCSDQGPARFAAIHKVFGASNVSKLLMLVPVPDRCEAVVTIAYEAQARLRDPVYGCVAHIFSLQQQVTCLQTQLMQVKAQLAHHNLMDTRNVVDQQHHHQWPNMMITDNHEGGSAVPSPSNNFPMMNMNMNMMNMNNNMMSSVSSQSSHESHNSTSCSTGFNSNNVQAENVNDQSSSSSRRSSRSDQELSNFLHQSPFNYNNATASTTTSTKKRPLNNDLGELQALALRMMRN